MKKFLNPLFTLLLLTTIGFGCSSASIDENDPVALMKEAEEEISSDHYQIALEKLRAIKNKFPYAKQSIDAHLRIADVYYLQEAYPEAAAVYEAFRDLHPKHEKTPYAMFRVGKSYLNDSPTIVARDLNPALKSLEAYQDFLRRFPNAPEAVEARKDVDHIRNMLADKELYIADFYFIRDFYESAKPRYEKVIELYPETLAAKTAQEKLAKIEAKLKTGDADGNTRTKTGS